MCTKKLGHYVVQLFIAVFIIISPLSQAIATPVPDNTSSGESSFVTFTEDVKVLVNEKKYYEYKEEILKVREEKIKYSVTLNFEQSGLKDIPQGTIFQVIDIKGKKFLSGSLRPTFFQLNIKIDHNDLKSIDIWFNLQDVSNFSFAEMMEIQKPIRITLARK